MSNFIKLNRKLKDKAFYIKDSEKVHLWIHLLLSANWSEKEESLGGKPYLCKCGQFTTGRKHLSQQTGINESKIERILTYFEKTEQQIEQQKTSTNRLISITNWNNYQLNEQQSKHRVNNDQTTIEQQSNTLKEGKENKEVKNKRIFIAPTQNEIIDYFVEKGFTGISAIKFYDYYSVANWHDSKGTKIRNWKQKAQSIWFKDENKINTIKQINPVDISILRTKEKMDKIYGQE